ncbi:MAG TPA: AMP-binding protein [Verrucomicrobiae bacterium]|nr:AMP-binding protein [Verrucomicrobiae bacterium]
MKTFDFGGEIVWRPTPELMAQSNLRRFMANHGLGSLEELQRRSVTDLDWFWNAVLHDLGIRFRRPYSRLVDLSRGIAWPEWCVSGVMNIVDTCLDQYAGTMTDSKTAIIWEGEEGQARRLSYFELRREVNRLANALRALGLGKGDAVGVFMPMTPEIVVAMLAIIKIGGVFLPLFSGFGPQAIASRLNDAAAKALFTADACPRRGKTSALKPIADEAATQIPTLRNMIVLKRLGVDVPWTPGRDRWWHELMAEARDAAETEPTNAEDPLMIIYTSGTSGQPKGAVHTHCGFPIKAAQDMSHGLDLHADETLYWLTDMGWMMGPWLVFGSLLLGATMMLYDGAPDWPEPDRLWSLVEKHKITSLGISPTLVRSLVRFGDQPVRNHDLSSLRKFASTGEPWNPDPWLWLFNVAGGGRLPIINYSGGTEISGGIVMGNVLTPLKPCSFAGPLPGMAADVVDEQGNSVRGQVGELVIRQPWIGMTRGFWRDPQRYIETYWSRLPDLWVHGDWAAVDGDGLWYILGRSDDTIKIAGKRVGPAEVESVLVGHLAVSEAAAIGVPDELKGEALVCFCVLKPSSSSSALRSEASSGGASSFSSSNLESLRQELTARIIHELGKPLAPRAVKFVRDLPKTRNAKVMRRIIRAAYLGKEPGDVSSLENPAAVDEVKNAI